MTLAIDSPDIMSASSDAPDETFTEAIKEAEESTPVEPEAEKVEENEKSEKAEKPSDSDEDDTPAEPPKKKKGVQKRIDELTARAYQAERERDYLNEQLKANQPPPDINAEAMPSLEQFGYDEERFALAMRSWANDSAQRQQQLQVEQYNQQQSELAKQRTEAAFQLKQEQFSESHPDFSQVVSNPNLMITNDMAQAIQVHELGADIAYHLGKTPELAGSIAALPPVQQAMEIGRLGVELSAPPKPVQRTVSKAPDPITPVGSNSVVEKSPEKMSYNEYRQARMSGKLK